MKKLVKVECDHAGNRVTAILLFHSGNMVLAIHKNDLGLIFVNIGGPMAFCVEHGALHDSSYRAGMWPQRVAGAPEPGPTRA
jgi:hypothetical protein